jgi:hypothetical protein
MPKEEKDPFHIHGAKGDDCKSKEPWYNQDGGLNLNLLLQVISFLVLVVGINTIFN